MKILITVIVVLVVVYLSVRTKGRSATLRTVKEIIEYNANEAVAMGRENFGIELDFSIDSIQDAETILGRLHDDFVKTKDMKGINGLALIMGVYIGECIRKNYEGASWPEEMPAEGPGHLGITWGDGTSYTPAWCFRRITNGPDENVWMKYTLLAMEREGTLPGDAIVIDPTNDDTDSHP